MRIYSGTLKFGQEVYNSMKRTTEKVARILRMHANKREPLEEAHAGAIVALLGLKATSTGDTLCSRQHPIVLEPISSYVPVISLAIKPVTRDNQERLGPGLERVCEEDPSLKVHTDEDPGQTLLSGMGELHLEVIIHRLEQSPRPRAGGPPRWSIGKPLPPAWKRPGFSTGNWPAGAISPKSGSPCPPAPGRRRPRVAPAGRTSGQICASDRPGHHRGSGRRGGVGHPAVDLATVLTDAIVREGQAWRWPFGSRP